MTKSVRTIVLGFIILAMGCAGSTTAIAPLPVSTIDPFSGPGEWKPANRETEIAETNSESLSVDPWGWRRWTRAEWTAIDANLDGRAEVLCREIKRDTILSECYQDWDTDGTIDWHYFSVQGEDNNSRPNMVKYSSPKLGKDRRGKASE